MFFRNSTTERLVYSFGDLHSHSLTFPKNFTQSFLDFLFSCCFDFMVLPFITNKLLRMEQRNTMFHFLKVLLVSFLIQCWTYITDRVIFDAHFSWISSIFTATNKDKEAHNTSFERYDSGHY